LKRVVFDTDVWISGIAFEGEVRKLLTYALEGHIMPVTSLPLLRELERVLLGRKFRYPPAMVSTILTEIQDIAILTHPTQKVKIIKVDPADNLVLECALSGDAEAIVTGDQHLQNVKSFSGIPILSPTALFETLREKP